MRQAFWMGLGLGLAVGVGVGYGIGHSSRGEAAAPIAPLPQPAEGGASEAQQRLLATRLAADKDPKNVQAWIALGNGYFDLHDPPRAIEAYDRALALDPQNPDVLTDQGVMYREARAFDKAVANFEKASRLAPKHPQSLYNLAVVYSEDLGRPQEALRAWKRVIEAAPASPQAAKARQAIEAMKGSAPAK